MIRTAAQRAGTGGSNPRGSEPIPGARVAVNDSATFQGLAPGTYFVCAWHPDHPWLCSEQLELAPGTNTTTRP